MPIEVLPLPKDSEDDSSFQYSIVIDSTPYVFDLTWMDRQGSWYLSIFDRDLNPLRTGVRMVIGWPLNLHDLDERLFGGILLVSRTDDNDGVDPRFEDFDGSVVFSLISGADLIPESEDPAPSLIVEAAP